jgi:ABC-type spermidine/putrescine transport system permease subunit II
MAIIAFGLVVWFGLSCLLIPQLLKNDVSWSKIAYLLPIFHGYTLEWWLAGTSDRFSWSRAVVISIILPLILALALTWTSNPKAAIICGGVTAFALTVVGYCLLIA